MLSKRTIPLLFLIFAAAMAPLPAFPGTFIRGDADHGGVVELSDAIRILDVLFRARSLSCLDSADANDDGLVDVSDAVKILLHLFGGENLPPPFPESGPDPTRDLLPCGDDPCPWEFRLELRGWIPDPRLNPSGIAAGRRSPHLIWAINDYDSQQDPTLYGLDHSGSTLVVISLCSGAEACPPDRPSCSPPAPDDIHCDWEGLTIGPDPAGRQTLYVGDIGANRNRGHDQGNFFWIHRVPEPEITTGQGLETSLFRDQGQFDTLYFRYPGGSAVDAEVLLLDPRSGDILLVSMHVWSATPEPRWIEKWSLYRYPPPQRPFEMVTLEHVGDIESLQPGTFVSGGDLSPSGNLLALKSRARIYFLPWFSEDPLWAFRYPPRWCSLDLAAYVPQPLLHAGEVAFDSEGRLLSMEESTGSMILRVEY